MKGKFFGRVLKYGDSLNTDVIIAGKYLSINPTLLDELAKHAMEAVDPIFPDRVKQSPILVGGKNFGCGSSRERAPIALKASGVTIIVAESFGRIFFRNAINIGLPVMICQNIASKVKEGEELEIDLRSGEITNLSTEERFKGEKLPGFLLEIIESGGLIPLRKKELLVTRGQE
ncbi:3-isopropylmalate dehydratase small subunit [Chloroflexota bacterium]